MLTQGHQERATEWSFLKLHQKKEPYRKAPFFHSWSPWQKENSAKNNSKSIFGYERYYNVTIANSKGFFTSKSVEILYKSWLNPHLSLSFAQTRSSQPGASLLKRTSALPVSLAKACIPNRKMEWEGSLGLSVPVTPQIVLHHHISNTQTMRWSTDDLPRTSCLVVT